MIARRIAASPAAVLEAAVAAPIETRFADPVEPAFDGGTIIRWTSVPDLVDRVERVAEVRPDGDGSVLALEARYAFRLPYFRLLFAPLVAHAVRGTLSHMAEVIEARACGTAEPPPRKRPAWATRDRMTPGQAATIATICCALAAAGYGGGLFTQALDFIASSFHASDADLGVALSVTRAGTLVGLFGAALADRRGRRLILLASVALVCVASGISALAPGLAAFTSLQIFVRGAVQLATIVGYIAITEEAPEGSRAFLLAIGGMATGAGFAIGAALLPIADAAAWTWRLLFAAALLGVVLLPGLARRLPETGRYAAMSERAARASPRELLDSQYGGRFALVAGIGFLLAFFGSPSLQWTNRYLTDVRGYSAASITLLRAVTQALPALFAIVAGGRLAESRGRKPVAASATFALALATVGFFLLGGPAVWLMMLVGTVVGALSGPAVTAFSTELFPTEVRGRASAALLTVSVLGSVGGLLLVGYLAGPLGHVGRAVAVTTAAPAIAALVLIPRLPEARGRALDDVSPPEV